VRLAAGEAAADRPGERDDGAGRLGDRHLFTGCVRDLTARAPLEATGRQTEQLMLVGRLAVGVFHELRAPLNTIFLQADLLAEEVRQPPSDSQTQIAASVADIKTEITRLAELIQDHLSSARPASPQPTAVELGPLVQALAQEIRELWPYREAA
jgi:signal transduction histidine kinase